MGPHKRPSSELAFLRLAAAGMLYLVLCASAAQCQPVMAGVIGGITVTQDFEDELFTYPPPSTANAVQSTPRRWLAGAGVEARLKGHLSFEVNALYHELEYTFFGIEPDGTHNSVSPSHVVTFEFPVMAKYRFGGGKTHLYMEGGPCLRTAGNLNGTRPSDRSLTVGVGVERRFRWLRIAPEVRYLRWAVDKLPPHGIAPPTRPDQVELLIGFSL
jgi:hypothetical protein